MALLKQTPESAETAVPVVPPKKSGGKKKWIILLFLVALAVLAAAWWFRSRGRSTGSQLSYATQAVETRTIVKSLTGSGTLQPANSYTVTTLIEGEVLSADFEEGDLVEKDAVLYQVDSSDAANNIQRSQISLNQAQISLNQARRSYEDSVDSRYVKATSGGIVYSLDVEVGDDVTQGQTVATIRDSSEMKLVVPFPSDDAASFSMGQPAQVTLDGSFETLSGVITSISGSDIVGTGNTITRNVTISVQNPGALGDAQTATASVGGVGGADSGTFTYRSESTVTATAAGTVTAIHVSEGGAISKNQTLLTLGGGGMEEQLQRAAESLQNAELSMENNRLSMENTQKQLEDYTITSPISGTIVDKQYKAGDTIESGKQLCTIYDLSYLEMTMNIDELDISAVSVGQSVLITADAVENQEFKGLITKVSVAGATSGGITSYPVTVRIDDTQGLLPGMNADAEIVIKQVENALSVPSDAVTRGEGNVPVALVTAGSPSAANATGQQAPDGYAYVQVETGVSDDSYTQIVAGLQEGDVVAYVPQSSGSSFNRMMGPMGMGGEMPAGGGGGGPAGGGGFR